jgi:Predicted enzyme related to lactoylglutathione lyase
MSPTTPLFRKIDCVRLHVDDLDAALDFYCGQLGHRLLWRTDAAIGLGLPDSDSEIVLTRDDIGVEVDFLVDSVDEAAAQVCAGGGKVITPPFNIQIGRCVVVQDPWGNTLVLLDMSKGALVTDAEGNVIGNQIVID